MLERIKRYWDIIRRPSVHYSLGFLTLGGFIGGIVFWGALQHGDGGDEHRGLLHRLPRDARQRVRRAEDNDPLHQPLRRAGHLLQLPCAARLDRQDGAQDAGLQGGLGQDIRHHRHAGEVPRQAARAGAARVGAIQGERLAGVPQLPSIRSMDFTRQSVRAQNMHSTYLANKEKTCIDCHKGIAHRLPHIPAGEAPTDTPGQVVPAPRPGEEAALAPAIAASANRP